jgi:hypothetical protein
MEESMSHGPEHQIEHAEHAVHASHDEFNKRVTMSIAIVAAALACVTMLGHRAHNETLILQGEALDLTAKASIKSTEAAGKWQYYQSKNSVNFLAQVTSDLLKVIATREGSKEELKELVDGYDGLVQKYSGDKDVRLFSKDKKKTERTHGKLKDAEDEALELEKDVQKLLAEAKEKENESHNMHAKAVRFDLGELGLQFGVVLCSLGILTKGRGFWFAGLAASAVGLAIALTGQFELFLGHH